MKRLVFDLDGTLTVDEPGVAYIDKRPNLEMIQGLRKYYDEGFEIIIATSRNMRTYNNSVGKINANTLPVVVEWLRKHDVPFHEIHVAKPWCGNDGFYIDDKSIRPSEFRTMTFEQITALLERERGE
jgi:capsule biosynthesis phosphatase